MRSNRNEVKVYIKAEIYKDLEAVSKALNKPMARLLREIIEQDTFVNVIKEMRSLTDSIVASKLYDTDLFNNE